MDVGPIEPFGVRRIRSANGRFIPADEIAIYNRREEVGRGLENVSVEVSGPSFSNEPLSDIPAFASPKFSVNERIGLFEGSDIIGGIL